MTLQKSVTVINASLDAEEAAIGASPKLQLRTGNPPADCAAADTGTLLSETTLPADWMAAASGGSKAKSATAWTGTGAAEAGTGTDVGHFRIKQSDGTVCHYQGTVGYSVNGAWAGTTGYTVGQRVSNGGSVYQCITAGTSASSGGPTGTSTDITDGTAHWAYVGPAGDMSMDNIRLASGQGYTVSGFTITGGNA